jgi:hypothetical protein
MLLSAFSLFSQPSALEVNKVPKISAVFQIDKEKEMNYSMSLLQKSFSVIPAKAGIQLIQIVLSALGGLLSQG